MTSDSPSDPTAEFIFIVRHLLERLFRLIFTAITVRGFQPTVGTYVYSATLVGGTLCNWFTILTSDPVTAMRSLCMVNLAHQGCIKLFSYLWKRRVFPDKLDHLHRIYLQCSAPDPQTGGGGGGPRAPAESAILSRWMRHQRTVLKLYFVIVALSALTFFGYPLYSVVWLGRNEFPLPIYPPGLDGQQPSGIAGIWAFQLLLTGGTCIGLMCADNLMVVLLLHACPMSELLGAKLRAMGDQLCREQQRYGGRPVAAGSDRRTREFLHMCIRMHQEYVRYMGDLQATYYLIFTVEVMSNFLSLCFVMYVMMVMVWPPLIGLAVTFLMKTFYVCVLGMLVEIYTEKVLEEFVAFPYYVLCLADQRKLALCIQRAQEPLVLMAGTIPLNMALFVSFLKNTYTVSMLLNAMIAEQ